MSKKATIVPGVHDLIPPDGRLTLELLHPDTGRVRHRVRAENAIMDWLRKNVAANGGRRDVGSGTTGVGFDSFNPIQETLPEGVGYADQATGWPASYPANVFANWLWATDQNVTPDSTKLQIPTGDPKGEVTAGAKLDSSWSADGIQFKRGTIVPSSCLRTWDRTRMVFEYGLAYGNGIYRSLGLGTLINQRAAPGGMRAAPATLGEAPYNSENYRWVSSVNTPKPASDYPVRGCVDYEEGGYWYKAFSFTGLTRWPPATTTTINLVSLANLPGSGGQFSVAVNGSDFWIGRNKGLYRCVKPTSDVAMTVTDTYDLTATLGADEIIDIAIDRVGNRVFLLTDTKVHVINGATGAPVSNFTHGLTMVAQFGMIAWNPAEQQLFVHNMTASNSGDDQGWGDRNGTPSVITDPDLCVIKGFTDTGGAAKALMGPQYGYASGSASVYSAYLTMMNDAGIGFASRVVSSLQVRMLGPSMASHALLGADFEKTDADALRITYDFDFTA